MPQTNINDKNFVVRTKDAIISTKSYLTRAHISVVDNISLIK